MIVDHPFKDLSKNYVPGIGPKPCRLMMIGEAPGFEEDQATPPRPFIGKTGRELDRFYLPMAGLVRREVYLTNLVKFHPISNRSPVIDEIRFCHNYLQQEIKDVRPEIIVPMGAFATRYFLGDVDLHTVHGLPHTSKKYPGVLILPSYHVAAGLHNTDTQPLIVYDFQQIYLAMQGQLPPRPEDPHTNPLYTELFNADEVFGVLDSWDVENIGMDTEGLKGNPWGLSFSFTPGIAYVIRASSREALAALNYWLERHPKVLVILHHALHDLPILRELGVRVRRFVDTMVLAYELCLEPQGLKDLAYRHCGMKMKSYDEVTGPAVRKLTAQYLLKVASGDWGLDPPVPERDSDEIIKFRQPQALHKRALKAVNDIFGMYTGTIIGPKRGGSSKLDCIGVRVGKVDHAAVAESSLPKTMNAWLAEVPLPVMDRLDPLWGEFIWELKDPKPPEEPADPIKRWKAMDEDLEESVARCEEALGPAPNQSATGLDAVENQQDAVNYSARDAHATVGVYPMLLEKVKANGLWKLAELDMAVMPYIDRMTTTGILVNRRHMLDYGDQLAIEMRQLQVKLKEDLGIWINPSSSQQVADVIYNRLGFPVEVRTEKGDPSTNDKVLEALSPLHPSINDITTYREMHKLRSTYALKLVRWTDQHSRVHPNWKATRVPTGRLACSDPNLMAIPVRSKRGSMIRAGFVPKDGCVFVGVDLSQIEMRILAHLSQDPTLIDLFLTGKDFHTATAAAMWKCSLEEIDADHKLMGGASKRSSGKNVSFGIVYGVTAKGLQAQVKSKTHQDWSEEECQRMIDLWLDEAYVYVKYYMERQKALAKRNGFVQTLMGRRRYLPGVNSSIPRIREEAGRQAINMPVQGSASEVIKLAMRNLWDRAFPAFWESGVYVEPILQVHDELIFEVDAAVAPEWTAVVKDTMQNALQLCVPVLADAHIAVDSWAGLK